MRDFGKLYKGPVKDYSRSKFILSLKLAFAPFSTLLAKLLPLTLCPPSGYATVVRQQNRVVKATEWLKPYSQSLAITLLPLPINH